MARYKVKGRDCQLEVKVKLAFKEVIDERQLDFFSSKYIRGLLKVQAKKKNCIEFYGPIGISLFDRLKKPISSFDLNLASEISDCNTKISALEGEISSLNRSYNVAVEAEREAAKKAAKKIFKV